MRTSTLALLLILALAFAVYGWKALGAIALALILIPVLLILLGIVAVLVLRAKMKRDVRRFFAAFGRPPERGRPSRTATAARKPEGGRIVDVEARDVPSAGWPGPDGPDARARARRDGAGRDRDEPR